MAPLTNYIPNHPCFLSLPTHCTPQVHYITYVLYTQTPVISAYFFLPIGHLVATHCTAPCLPLVHYPMHPYLCNIPIFQVQKLQTEYTQKTKAARTYKLLVKCQLVQHHIPEDLILYQHHCWNFKSHTYQLSPPHCTNLLLEGKIKILYGKFYPKDWDRTSIIYINDTKVDIYTINKQVFLCYLQHD
jgi:hypothetical protein